MTVRDLGINARKTQTFLSQVTSEDKNRALCEIAKALVENKNRIIEANKTDLENGRQNGLSAGLLDRLMLDESRIQEMAHHVAENEGLENAWSPLLEKDIAEIFKASL